MIIFSLNYNMINVNKIYCNMYMYVERRSKIVLSNQYVIETNSNFEAIPFKNNKMQYNDKIFLFVYVFIFKNEEKYLL